MNRTNKHQHAYLKALNEGIIVFDGAMGTNLEAQGLHAEQFGGSQYQGCNDHLNLSSPEAVRRVHRSFLETGVDVIETNTFRSNRFTLAEFDLGDKVLEINLAGAKIARQCADEFSRDAQKKFVAGSMGPSGRLVSLPNGDGPAVAFHELLNLFAEQAKGLIQGGVDLLLLETQQDILEVKAAIQGIQQAFEETGISLPIQVQVTLDASSRMLLGTHISAVTAILSDMDIDVLGINCSTGPDAMRSALETLSRESPLPISCLPNSGMPENINGRAVYSLSPELFSDTLSGYMEEFGLSVVGGCCGTRPEHLRMLVEKVRKMEKIHRKIQAVPRLSSAFNPLDLRQEPAPLLIGERLNTQGSRRFKQIVLEDKLDQALEIAKEQIMSGAHALDLCTALTESANEKEIMVRLVQKVGVNIDAPLVIDSTNPQVLEAALQAAPGRCLLNSINLENGNEKARSILALARNFNAAVIALTIDEAGMASTAERKLAVARRIRDLAVHEFGLKDSDLIFDPLTFTLASGSEETADAGIETLKAIALIKKEIPGAFTCLGVSNISYGLKPQARAVLNSVFLYHAIKAGLDLAIINPAQVRPYTELTIEERENAEDLIFNRDTRPLEKFIQSQSKNEIIDKKDIADRLETLDLGQRIYQRILMREREGLEKDLKAFIEGHDPHSEAALSLLNDTLLPAMKKVGDQFGRGELILPFVLQSAEIMRTATQFLEKYLEKDQTNNRGKIILATVFGDVHDIGKNLVATILANNGFDVIDLGKQVPADLIVKTAIEENADAIGLSALLVSTSQQMRIVVEMLREIDQNIPVLIGGAAINQDFAQIIASKNGRSYPVHYCRDAFDALEILNGQQSIETQKTITALDSPEKSSIGFENHNEVSIPDEIPVPPFIGYRRFQLSLSELFIHLNQSALFRMSWGARNARGEKWEKLSGQFSEIFEKLREELISNPWISPSALYGYFPCNADHNDLVVYIPDEKDPHQEIRFHFPRQSGDKGLCLADYFAPINSGETDIAAFQIVTLGQDAADHVHLLQEAQGITEAFYAHGLAVQLTEAAAKYAHERIRRELGLEKNRGKRYAWGFPALPDLSQHELLFKLLPAEGELGIHMTSAYQFIPEYTTAALVVHHPDAGYFRME